MSDPLCPDCGQPFTSNVMQGCHICNESDLLRKLLDDAERERDEQKKRAEKASLIASREATVSKVSLDQANQMIDSLTEERDRWTDDCLKTRAERDQLKRERDAAQGEIAALRTALERIRDEVLPHKGIRWIATLCETALATPSTAGERWKAMERVCEAVDGFRKGISRRSSEGSQIAAHEAWYSDEGIALNRAMRALAALEKGE